MNGSRLSRKERTRRALLREPVDRLPHQINYTDACGQLLADDLGVSMDALPGLLNNHLLRLDLDFDQQISSDGRIRYDWWGVGFDTRQEGYFAAVHPLAAAPDLDAYPWPDPQMPDLFQRAFEITRDQGESYFVVPNLGFALFERAWLLRGFEQFLLDLVSDITYAGLLLDRIVEIQAALIERYLDLGIDGAYFGDDYGAQKNLLFSPRLWRKLIKPRLAHLFAPFKERKMPIILHSDGQIDQILPDLVEIGLTTLNPVQPEVIDHHWLQQEFGHQLSFYGGVSTQTVLPHGTPEQVEKAILETRASLAPEGTGLLIAPSHRLMRDIPLDNFKRMLELFTGDGWHG